MHMNFLGDILNKKTNAFIKKKKKKHPNGKTDRKTQNSSR